MNLIWTQPMIYILTSDSRHYYRMCQEQRWDILTTIRIASYINALGRKVRAGDRVVVAHDYNPEALKALMEHADPQVVVENYSDVAMISLREQAIEAVQGLGLEGST